MKRCTFKIAFIKNIFVWFYFTFGSLVTCHVPFHRNKFVVSMEWRNFNKFVSMPTLLDFFRLSFNKICFFFHGHLMKFANFFLWSVNGILSFLLRVVEDICSFISQTIDQIYGFFSRAIYKNHNFSLDWLKKFTNFFVIIVNIQVATFSYFNINMSEQYLEIFK